MSAVPLCRQCGAPLPAEGWEELCPKCLVPVVLETPAEPAGYKGQARAAFAASPADQGARSEPAGNTVVLSQPDIAMEKTGVMIGRYKLLQQIGEGGFGVVFMAQQTEPVQRKVALKVIKAGMDTREIIARFEAERQALALMDHPNIARVLDGGATAGGRPYFVMELVRGIPVTDYCDQANLSTRERLELFIKVCRAVQHAHQKGVIHRDLKPSNVLVMLHDEKPVPKVIDFGVAKALAQKLTDKTLFTRFEQMIGTPAYMSPEQASLGGLDIDTRSDVYSLGVLLYELLTGVTPLDAEVLRHRALDEIRRLIRETDPPKPSTRLLGLGARLTEVAKRRQAEPVALSRSIRGDLDWITMKALEKDRQRRYETVNGLAMDLERHLKDEPVVARPPGALYRLQKAARRHRLAFAVGTVVAFSLVLGLVTSTWEAIRATRAEAQARLQSAENQAVMEILEQTLSRSDPTGESTRQGLLDSTTLWLNRERRGEERPIVDFVRTMRENMLNLRRSAAAEPIGRSPGATTALPEQRQAFTNANSGFQTATNLAWLAIRQTNYAQALAQAEKALASRPQNVAQPLPPPALAPVPPAPMSRPQNSETQPLAVEALAKLEDSRAATNAARPSLAEAPKPNHATPPILRGLILVPSTEQVERQSPPGIRGVVVRGPEFLTAKSLEPEIASLFGKPVTELELLSVQKKLVDWCRNTGHALVEVAIPEQEIVDGVLQVVVTEAQPHSSPR